MNTTIGKYGGAAVLASALLAGACANDGKLGADFGDSVHNNMAVHVVEPTAGTAVLDPPTMDGERANLRIKKYKVGQEEKLEVEQTSKKGAAAK